MIGITIKVKINLMVITRIIKIILMLNKVIENHKVAEVLVKKDNTTLTNELMILKLLLKFMFPNLIEELARVILKMNLKTSERSNLLP
jgi:hypothetical protein